MWAAPPPWMHGPRRVGADHRDAAQAGRSPAAGCRRCASSTNESAAARRTRAAASASESRIGRDGSSDGSVDGRGRGAGRAAGRVVRQRPDPGRQREDPQRLRVQRRLADFAAPNRRRQRAARSVCGGPGISRSSPAVAPATVSCVACQSDIRTPSQPHSSRRIAADELLVLRAVNPVDEVVGRHHRPGPGSGHRLEREQVDLAQGPLVDDAVDRRPMGSRSRWRRSASGRPRRPATACPPRTPRRAGPSAADPPSSTRSRGRRAGIGRGSAPGRACSGRPPRLASAPIRAATSRTRSTSQVAPRAVPHGVQVALEPIGKVMPRTPFGPSRVSIGPRPIESTPAACQASAPDVSRARSSMLSDCTSSSSRSGDGDEPEALSWACFIEFLPSWGHARIVLPGVAEGLTFGGLTTGSPVA